jgi:hypothetical protein
MRAQIVTVSPQGESPRESVRPIFIIVYQGPVRIPESKNINFWQVRKFEFEKSQKIVIFELFVI